MVSEMRWNQVGTVLVARPSGDLVGDTAHQWLDQLRAKLDQGQENLILDLRNVETFSSHFLGELLFLTKDIRDAGGEVKILNLCPFAAEIFNATRLLRTFEIFNDEQTALMSFPPGK